jgi:hypothetical protein
LRNSRTERPTSIGEIEPVAKELVQGEMETVARGLAGWLLDVAGSDVGGGPDSGHGRRSRRTSSRGRWRQGKGPWIRGRAVETSQGLDLGRKYGEKLWQGEAVEMEVRNSFFRNG